MDLMCLIFLIFVLVITYWHLKRIHSHWENQSVPSVPNPNVIFGNLLPVITNGENVCEFIEKVYKNFNSSVVGFYFMRTPGIIVRDPDLVKRVLQTNFSSFRDNFLTLNEKNDPVLGKNPFFTSNANLWRERRNRISNNLSGKKLKLLSVIIQEICNRTSAFVDKKIEENGGSYECELKQFFTRCTSEVVMSAAFSIEGQSFEDNPGRLSFTEIGRTLLEPSLINGIKQAILFFLPKIANFLNLAFVDHKTDDFMRQFVKEILEKRGKQGVAPNDYLQFSLESISDLDDILAEVVNFFADVYETSSIAMANLSYHLSVNSEIQSKLRNHVISVLKKTDDQSICESLKNMTYMDQVVNESLRMIPPIGSQLKVCTKEITLKGADGINCHLKPGDPVCIPTIALQRDDKFWPNPEVFNPERFSPENRIHNTKFAFLPFSEGPRMCVGMRLGLMLMKQITATLITKFAVEYSSKTKVPLKMEPTSIMTVFGGGLWARFKKLN